MTTEAETQQLAVLNSPTFNIKEAKANLKEWKPTSRAEAVKMLARLSVISNADTLKKVKTNIYNFLNRIVDKEIDTFDIEGFTATRVNQQVKVFTCKSELLEYYESQLEELKVDYKKEEKRLKALISIHEYDDDTKFDPVPTFKNWKVG